MMRLWAISSLWISATGAFQPRVHQQQQSNHRHGGPLCMASTPISREPANSSTPWKGEPTTSNASNHNANSLDTFSAAQGIHDLNNVVAHSQFKASRRPAAMTMPPEVVRPQQPLPLVDYMMPSSSLTSTSTTTDSSDEISNTEEDAWWDDEEEDDGAAATTAMGEITVGKMSYLDSLVPPEQQDLPTFIPSPLASKQH